MLHHDNAIGTAGNGRSGHDFNGLAGADGACEALSGAHFADHCHAAGKIRRTNREAVAHGPVKRRIGTVGGHVLSEDAAGGGLDRGKFERGNGTLAADFAQYRGSRFGERQGRHEFSVAGTVWRAIWLRCTKYQRIL